MKHVKRFLALCLILLLTLAGVSSAAPQGPEGPQGGAPPQRRQNIPYEPDAELPPVESYRADPVDFAEDEASGLGYVRNLVVVYFAPEATAEQKNRAVAAVKGEVVGRAEAIGKWTVLTPGESLAELRAVCAALEAQPGVAAAMEDHVLELCSQAVTTNDPWTYGTDDPADSRWYMDAIEAPEAWEYNGQLKEQPCVGMVDQGVLANHDELSKIVTNLTAIIPEENFSGHGYTFQQVPTLHGTAVASLMAARANNGLGITGLCWNAKVYAFDWKSGSDAYLPQITPNPESLSAHEKRLVQESVVLDGLLLCVQKGARAVNCSLGAIPNEQEGSMHSLTQEQRDIYAAACSQFLAQMLAYSDTAPQFRRFVVAQSAGNQRLVTAVHNGLFACITPSNTGQSAEIAARICDMVLIVGAVQKETTGVFKQWDKNTNNYNGTSAGSQVSLYAPGANMLIAANGISLYYKDSGTSYATPLVTGTAALMSAANPSLTGSEIGALLKSAAVSPRVVRDRQTYNYTLYPMLNAKLALQAALAMSGLTLRPALGSEVAVQESFVKHIEARTPASALLASLEPTNGTDTLVYAKAAATPGAWAATGDVITVEDSQGRKADYTIVVEGDVSGEGRVNALDSLLLDMHLNGILDLAQRGAAFMMAADFDRNGVADHEDRKLLAWAGVME